MLIMFLVLVQNCVELCLSGRELQERVSKREKDVGRGVDMERKRKGGEGERKWMRELERETEGKTEKETGQELGELEGTFTPASFGSDFQAFQFGLNQISRCETFPPWSGPNSCIFIRPKEVVSVQIKLNHSLVHLCSVKAKKLQQATQKTEN